MVMTNEHYKTTSVIQISDKNKPTDNFQVSVHVLSYNHELSLRKCLDNILSQKVDFNVEIIVHDDCSTDLSLSICLEYKNKYPYLFTIVSEKTNLYKETNGVLEIEKKLTEISKGKYIALCEGDDYWIDDLKLFTQYHSLLDKPDICFCVHRVLVNNVSNGSTSYYPVKKIRSGIIKSKKFISIVNDCYSFQTSSYFIKTNACLEFYNKVPKFAIFMPTNDEAWLLYFGSKSDVMYIDSAMSCYNKMMNNSWTSKESLYTPLKRKENRLSVVKSINEFNNYTNFVYNESCQKRISHNMLMVFINDNDFRSIFENKDISREFWRLDKKSFIKKWIKTYVFKK